MWKAVRITVLLVVLVIVAGTTWIDRARTTSWKAPLWVGIFPINGDGSAVSERYVSSLTTEDFAAIETRAEQSRAASARLPAVAYCQGTVFRSEIEAREPGSLDRVTDYVASQLEARHGSGEVAAKIQAHIILAAR